MARTKLELKLASTEARWNMGRNRGRQRKARHLDKENRVSRHIQEIQRGACRDVVFHGQSGKAECLASK